MLGYSQIRIHSPVSYILSHTGLALLALQVRVEGVPKGLARIVEPQLLVDALDLLHVLRVQLEVALQVRRDARGRLGFGKHGVALGDAPGERNLGAGFVVLLADLNEDWVVLRVVSQNPKGS